MSQNKIILCKSCGKEIASDALAMYIKGIVKNNSGKDCTYVQITN
ncbi:MAG: hypothetical protein RR867_01830 [Ruthenibacterium sp.]